MVFQREIKQFQNQILKLLEKLTHRLSYFPFFQVWTWEIQGPFATLARIKKEKIHECFIPLYI